jgi:hypothetical protein
MIGTDITKFQEKMTAIEGLKRKIAEKSEVAFQEKSFKQSDQLQALVIGVKEAQERSMQESREMSQHVVELMAEITKSQRPPTRMGIRSKGKQLSRHKLTIFRLGEEEI